MLPMDPIVAERAKKRRRERQFHGYQKRIASALDGLVSESTLQQYISKFRLMHTFCISNSHHFPIQSEKIFIEFLESKQSWRFATLRSTLDCLKSIYEVLKLDFPNGAILSTWLKKRARQIGTRQKQAFPLTGEVLRRLLALQTTECLLIQTQIIVRVGFDSLLRADSLAKLEFQNIEKTTNGRSKIFVDRSKTDQERAGLWAPLSASTTELLAKWKNSRHPDAKRLFSKNPAVADTNNNQVDNKFITASLRKLAFKCNIDPATIQKISSHSLRVGASVDALYQGMNVSQLKILGGWSSTSTVEKYIRNADPVVISETIRRIEQPIKAEVAFSDPFL